MLRIYQFITHHDGSTIPENALEDLNKILTSGCKILSASCTTPSDGNITTVLSQYIIEEAAPAPVDKSTQDLIRAAENLVRSQSQSYESQVAQPSTADYIQALARASAQNLN